MLNIDYSIGNDIFNGYLTLTGKEAFEILEVKFNKPEYISGDKAQILAKALVLPNDPEREFYLEAKINGSPNLVFSEKENNWEMTTSRLNAGNYTVSLQLFLQNKRLSSRIQPAVRKIKKEISLIDDRISRETDPEIILELQQKKAVLEKRIQLLESELSKTRVIFGEPFEKEILVN